MAPRSSSSIHRGTEQAVKIDLLRAYLGLSVMSDKYHKRLRRAHDLHVTSFREMNTVPLPGVDYLADKSIRASMKLEKENNWLKRLVAELSLEKEVLCEVAQGTY